MRLEALLKLNHFDDAPMEVIMEFAFKETVRLTKSSFGYLALAGVDGMTYFIDSLNKYHFGKNHVIHTSSGFPLETMGLWGDAIKKKKPIIANDYPTTNPMKKGVPKRYCNIVRYMNIPVFNNGKIVAVAGVGDKKSNYDESDLRQLTLLMEGMWKWIQRREAEIALRNSEKLFRDLVENSLTGISIIQNIHPEDNKKAKDFFEPFFTTKDYSTGPGSKQGNTKFSKKPLIFRLKS